MRVANEAHVAYLCKKLEKEHMDEGQSMDVFLTNIKDWNEKLIAMDEIIPNSSLVQIVLDGLPDFHQSFASTIQLLMKDNPNALQFHELCAKLLQEE